MTKGEKIVTNLVGEHVTPKIVAQCIDCDAKDARHKIGCPSGVWPKNWISVDTLTPDGKQLGIVVAVYLKDGSVMLLVRNCYGGAMIETPAVEWSVR